MEIQSVLLAVNPTVVQNTFLVFMFVWLLFVGGCIGSFMNVVIYRLPAGLSTARPGSRCPHCCHAIRWFDNIPVISWFVLRARCRDCQAPISGRYASVEALIAVTVVGLAAVEVYLPTRNQFWLSPADWVAIWGRFAVHVLLVCTAVCAAFMEFDRRRVPLRLFGLATISGLAGILTIQDPLVQVEFCSFIRGPVSALRDSSIGALLGWLVAPVVLRAKTANRRFRPSRAAIVVAGGVLGWQAVLVFAPVAAGLSWCISIMSQKVLFVRRIPPSASVVVSLLLLLFVSPAVIPLVERWQTAMVEQDRTGVTSALVVVAAIASLLLMVCRPLPSSFGPPTVARSRM